MLVLLLLSSTHALFSQKNITKNHVLIIDCTASMKGETGGPNIWEKVKKNSVDYIENLDIGEEVTLITYSKIPKIDPSILITSQVDKDKLKSKISLLNANGQKTCTYNTLTTIFDGYNLDTNKINIIQLFTDGANNCNGSSAQSAIEKYGFKRGKYDFLFIITLGFEAPSDLVNVVALTKNAEIISAEEDELPYINIVSPKALSLEFTKETMSLNQGFHFYSASQTDNTLRVKVDFRDININGLTNTMHSIDFTKNSFLVSKNEKITLQPLNPLDDLNEGIYCGTYQYKHDPTNYTYIIPNEVGICLKNIPESKVTIKFKTINK